MRQFNLREEIKKMVMVLSSIHEGIIIVDKKGQIIFFNPTAEIITGYLGADVFSKKINTILNFTGGKINVQTFLKEALGGERAIKTEGNCFFLRKDGRKTPIEGVASPLYDSAGEFEGSIIVLRDLTEENKLKQRQREFLSFISHQLRLPLGSFRWGIEIILSDKEKLEPTHRELLNDLYGVTIRLVDFVHDLLEISRLEEGRISFKPEPIDLIKITKDTFQDFKGLATSFNINFNFFPAKEKIGKIFVDPERFKDIIKNLISNAIMYNKKSGLVTIDAKNITAEELLNLVNRLKDFSATQYFLESLKKERKTANNFLLYSVADTGLGIPEKQKEQIFTSFFRAQNVIDKGINGTGTGLYFTKSIVESSGGWIFFESKENVGTTFYLVFSFC